MASGEKLNTDFTDLNWYKRQQRQSMGRAHPICMSEMQGKAELWAPNLHQSYILHLILHPILHPKSPINTGRLGHGCRKCRIFSENFFCGERKSEGTHRPGSHKTSDFFGQKYGCFASKVPMFASKKSDVSEFRRGRVSCWWNGLVENPGFHPWFSTLGIINASIVSALTYREPSCRWRCRDPLWRVLRGGPACRRFRAAWCWGWCSRYLR